MPVTVLELEALQYFLLAIVSVGAFVAGFASVQ